MTSAKCSGSIRTEVDAEVLRTEVTVESNPFRREDEDHSSNLNGFLQLVHPFMRCIPVLHDCMNNACTLPSTTARKR